MTLHDMSSSHAHFGLKAIGAALVCLVVYGSVAPVSIDAGVEQGDKLTHVAAYFTLMLWFASLYERTPERIRIAGLLILLGIGLEFVQAAIPYRSFELGDMVADAIGVCFGWLAAPPRLPNLPIKAQRTLLRVIRRRPAI